MFKYSPHRLLKDRKEEGFTLIELLVVILIIGILSAIAIPAYMKQRDAATAATLKTDLRNAATVMTSESVKTGGLYGTALPNYTDFSKGNLLSIVPESSNKEQFCLRGENESTEKPFFYSSKTGTFTEDKDSCEPVETTSYAVINKDKKVYLVSTADSKDSRNIMVKSLKALGYDENNIEDVSGGTLNQKSVDGIDTIVFAHRFWAANLTDLNFAYAFYEKGGNVLVEGNDNNVPQFVSSYVSLSNVGPNYKPTYNALTPSFPYSFKSDAFGSDSWACITGLKNNAVAIASSDSKGHDCVTMFGASNASGGQFTYVIFALDQSKIQFSQTYAALTWMMN